MLDISESGKQIGEKLFALFIMNPRRILTYDMITDLVWHENLDYYSYRAINRHVSNLQQKLRAYPKIKVSVVKQPG